MYAWAYREVLERCDADLFVVLGTCHAGMMEPFAATLKAFETPLGPVPADREFLDALGRRYGGDLFASEGAHRVEHSIEFQAVMLRWALGDRPFTMVPLLASFLHEAVWTGKGAEADGRVPRFLGALAETLAASPRRVCVVGGVDLAMAEGRIAGYVAAGSAALAQRFFASRARGRRFAAVLAQTFALRDELHSLAAPDTLVCRCEDVPYGQLGEHASWQSAKLHTRCGMGPCQGRVCGAATALLFGWTQDSVRPPIAPARLESLARTMDDGR